jgi:hypothetical protein
MKSGIATALLVCAFDFKNRAGQEPLVVISIRMFVAPLPVICLLLLAGPGKIAIVAVMIGLILPPRGVFAAIPVVVILVGVVVVALVVPVLVMFLPVILRTGKSSQGGNEDGSYEKGNCANSQSVHAFSFYFVVGPFRYSDRTSQTTKQTKRIVPRIPYPNISVPPH